MLAYVVDMVEQNQWKADTFSEVPQTLLHPSPQPIPTLPKQPSDDPSELSHPEIVQTSYSLPQPTPITSRRPSNDPPDPRSDHSHQNSVLEKSMDNLVDVNTKLTTATLEQNDMNRKLIMHRHLPNITIPVFNGDPLQYPAWKSSFEAFIDSQPMDGRTKLNFLSQYVAGKARNVVEHFVLIGSEDAYKSAKTLLHERYGNNNVVSSSLIGKLETWPSIGIKDAEALRDFSDFLLKIEAAKATLPSLNVLDFAKENVKMLAKLLHYIQNKWWDYIRLWRKSEGEDQLSIVFKVCSVYQRLC